MLCSHKIHIHNALLSKEPHSQHSALIKFIFPMLSSALSKFTFTNLSSQTSAIPQLIFSCSCFLGIVSSDVHVFNRGGQVCLACISNMKAGIRFFPFCFFFFQPSIACFSQWVIPLWRPRHFGTLIIIFARSNQI